LTEARAGLRRTRETLSNFTPFLKTRRKGLLLALFVLLLETGTSLAQPWPLAVALACWWARRKGRDLRPIPKPRGL